MRNAKKQFVKKNKGLLDDFFGRLSNPKIYPAVFNEEFKNLRESTVAKRLIDKFTIFVGYGKSTTFRDKFTVLYRTWKKI